MRKREERKRGVERERDINNVIELEREKGREIVEEFYFILECDVFKCLEKILYIRYSLF